MSTIEAEKGLSPEELKLKYFNFPIQLLEGFLDEPREKLKDILRYSLFLYSKSCHAGSELEGMEIAGCDLNVKYGDINYALKRAKQIDENIPDRPPMVGIHIPVFWDFRDNPKNDYEYACLLGYLALKSIIGNKPYSKVTNIYWWSRMAGKAKAVKSIKELPKELQPYLNHYQARKMRDTLKNKWHLKVYANNTRGFFVSIKLSFEKLVYEVEKNKTKNKKMIQKEVEKKAIIKALEKIRGSTNSQENSRFDHNESNAGIVGDFCKDWNELRTDKLRSKSNLNRIPENLLNNLNEIYRSYSREEIRNAMKALFAQKSVVSASMKSHPKHFLEYFETYLQAYNDKDIKVYGEAKKEDRL